MALFLGGVARIPMTTHKHLEPETFPFQKTYFQVRAVSFREGRIPEIPFNKLYKEILMIINDIYIYIPGT